MKNIGIFISITKHVMIDLIYLLIKSDLEACLLRNTASHSRVS